MRDHLKKLSLSAGILFFATLAYAGEINESRLEQVSLGMKTAEIISTLGQPEWSRKEGLNAEGKTMETLVYNVTKRIDVSKVDNDTGQREETVVCSLVIVDGYLVRIDRQR